MRAALDSIREGDRVIVRWVRYARIGKVTRRTPGGRFRVECQGAAYEFNKHGRQVGSAGAWDTPHLHPWSEEEGREIAEAAERSRLVSRFRQIVNWSGLPLDVLRQVDDITREAEAEEVPK